MLLLLLPLTVLLCPWLDATGFSLQPLLLRGTMPLSSHCSLCCSVALPPVCSLSGPRRCHVTPPHAGGSRGPLSAIQAKTATAINTIT